MACLLLAPVVAFFLLDVRVMAPLDMIDPAFYTAYAHHGPELMERYGLMLQYEPPGHNYFWVRLGFILPAHLMSLLFGPVGGFFAFRYVLALLATIPAYLLFRRLYGRWAGAVAVAVILTSPVVLLAWGTDYPDSSAVSYLLAGMACVVMPADSPGRRRLWLGAGGLLLALAFHSQVVSVPLVAGGLAGYFLVYLRRPRRETIAEIGLVAGVFLAVTLVLALAAQLLFGHWDIISPTLRAGRVLRTPEQLANWHSSNWRWVLYVPYVVVPPAVAATWLVARGRAWQHVPRPELALAAGFGLQVLAYYVLQFGGGRTGTLEYHLYSSMLWAGVCLTLAFVLVRLLGQMGQYNFVAPVLVVAVPLVYRFLRPTLRFNLLPLALALAAAVVLLALAAWRPRPAKTAGLVTGAVTAGGMLAGLLVLTVAVPKDHARPGSTTLLPKGQHAEMLGGDGSRDLDLYRVSSQLESVVPPPRRRGEDLVLWYPGSQAGTLNEPAAQYVWRVNALGEEMPALSNGDRRTLDRRRPGVVVLLSETGAEFPTALTALEQAAYRPRVVRQATLRSGAVTVHVAVLRLDRFS